MGTVSAIALVVFLVAASWWLYLRSGARAWSAERDPLGEPPVRMAALIAAIVVGVAVFSSGGGGAEHTSAMQQGADDVDGGLFSPDTETSEASVASGTKAAASDRTTTATSDRRKTAGSERTNAPSTKPRATATPGPSADASTPPAGNQPSTKPSSKLPSYGKLVVRARKAAEARGAEIRWYPTLAAEAREATERRSR